jgi:hypothetical protein
MLTLVFSGCDSVDSVFGSSDDDDDNGGDNTSVPDTAPDGSEGASTVSSYDNLELEWNDTQENGGGYLAAIYLNSGGADPAENYDLLEADVFDDTNDQDIDAGTYSYSEVDDGEADYGSNGTFVYFTVVADYNGEDFGSGAGADYVASTLTESEAAREWGGSWTSLGRTRAQAAPFTHESS